jgi:nucleoid-associated protein YgaU
MITVLSRYGFNPVVLSDGIVTASRKEVSDVSVFIYSVQIGDTMESLASKLFNDPGQWWRIADVNPQVGFPLDLTPGTQLRIPV